MIVHGDDFLADGRAEALLQVDEKPEETRSESIL